LKSGFFGLCPQFSVYFHAGTQLSKQNTMSLSDQINTDIKTAMKARDKDALNALRGIKAKLLLEATKEGAGDSIPDDVAMRILSKIFKQHNDSAAIYREQDRPDLAVEEEAQAKIIGAYLPQPMTEDELRAGLTEIVADMGASGMGDMGKVMGAASAKFAGKADGKAISGIVRELLA